jgi:hypothetical protein
MRPRRVLLRLAVTISLVWAVVALLGLVVAVRGVRNSDGSGSFVAAFRLMALPGIASFALCEIALRRDLKQDGPEGAGFPLLDLEASRRFRDESLR